jgi:hypothetical protein
LRLTVRLAKVLSSVTVRLPMFAVGSTSLSQMYASAREVVIEAPLAAKISSWKYSHQYS